MSAEFFHPRPRSAHRCRSVAGKSESRLNVAVAASCLRIARSSDGMAPLRAATRRRVSPRRWRGGRLHLPGLAGGRYGFAIIKVETAKSNGPEAEDFAVERRGDDADASSSASSDDVAAASARKFFRRFARLVCASC
jgi:hypothetical protein